MIVGNAKSIMERFGRGAGEYDWAQDANAETIRGNMSFIIKSFFFTLIGLMFPISPRLIALGAVAAVLLLLFRIPAVRLSLRGTGLSPRQLRMVDVAIPRGIAAGVLSALPLQYGVPWAENLTPGVFFADCFQHHSLHRRFCSRETRQRSCHAVERVSPSALTRSIPRRTVGRTPA